MGPMHFNVLFSCLCSIMINPTPTLTTTTFTIHVLVHNIEQAYRIWYYDDNAGFLHTCTCVRFHASKYHWPSPVDTTYTHHIASANPRSRRHNRPEKASSVERQTTRLPASADTAQSAAPPSRSARNERSLQCCGWRGNRSWTMYTPKRKAGRAPFMLVLAMLGGRQRFMQSSDAFHTHG